MQYKIIVDKQPSSNPSEEKKEYIIDIEELRVKGDVYDSLNIEMDRTYVTRRLSLSEYGVLSVLDEPVIQELTDLNIKLFEGDNYIYLMDMQGNKFYAEYIVKNDFTDLYVTTNQMNSSIEQTAQSIELSVNQKLEGYSTTQEMNSAIEQTAQSITSSVNQTLINYATNDDLEDEVTELNSTITQTASEINSEVSKKVGKTEIASTINQTAQSVKINASKIDLSGYVTISNLKTSGSTTINGSNITTGTIDASKVTVKNLNASNITSGTISGRTISGGSITGTSITNGNNFRVDKNGNMTCSNVNITGGKIKLDAGYASNPNFRIGGEDGIMMTDSFFSMGQAGFNSNSLQMAASTVDPPMITMMDSSNHYTEVQASGITTPSLTQTSLESIKKNINKFNKNATNIINNSDIYEYNLKSDEDTDKKLIGFIIGDKYRTPDEVISRDGQAVGLYSAIGILWKGFQEQEKIIKQLQENDKQKDKLLAELILRVEQLKKEAQHE